MKVVIDLTGWAGSMLLIVAYFRNSRGTLKAESFQYQMFNVVGSLLLIVNTVHYGAYPSSAVNVIWAVIGLRFIVKVCRTKKKLTDQHA